MIVLHDSTSGDLSHVQAMAHINEGFALFDYVRIDQSNGNAWIGQILEPNRNISIVNSNRLDPTILHGLRLMQDHPNVQSVESVQVFEIGILGEYNGHQMLTPRLRPLPGAIVTRLDATVTSRVIGIPLWNEHRDENSNVIGELLNAANVPLCIDVNKFNYHIMVTGGTGSGKSNVAANLIDQALKFGKCVLVHDAKPDYGLVNLANTDRNVNVTAIWERFEQYGLRPHPANSVIRIGFYGRCEPNSVTVVVGFRASDFSPEMLAGLFFTGSSTAEQNGFEGFVGAADSLWQEVRDQGNPRIQYSLEDILQEVERRSDPETSINPRDAIHPATGRNILSKVNKRRRGMPWLDAVGQSAGRERTSRLRSSRLDGNHGQNVQVFELESYLQAGQLLVIDYSHPQMDEQSYALIVSYFLRICQQYRRNRGEVGIVQMVDEAHRIFDNDSRHSSALERAFERVMREGRSVDHSIILSLQNASQIPQRVMNNLNTKIVMRQNSKAEADAATQTMGREFSPEAMRLGTGHALVSMHESRATVLAQMAPSPFELMRNDNTGTNANNRQPALASVGDDLEF